MTYSLGANPSFQTYGVVDTGSDLTCRNVVHNTLTLAPSSTSDIDGGKVAFPKTLFGCADKTTGYFVSESSGIVGLGRGSISLISQMGSSIQGKFLYCLTPMFSDKLSKLNFGQKAVVSGSGTISTPLVKTDNDNYYHMHGWPIEEGNTVIDSGSRLTILPQGVYFKVESEVIAKTKSGQARITRAFSLWYASESIESFGAPIITLHFRSNAHVKLNPMNTFILVSSGRVCFGFRPMMRSVSLTGNLAQVNLLVGFDLQNNIVSFKPTDCTMF
ncbi:aspartic proteinase CDR1-like [Neltuma alba]|uniref:aspartic proteinase CDR1-like n=1 Tax=Neltuma alba TaxID=207710 RepID=UPI0010A3EC7A|nr:aspartic proteinase CDR1-like [Prosopis alba]